MPTERQRSFRERITTDPQVMVGKPVVKGTRVPVEHVIQHLAGTPDVEDVLQAYPHLTPEDIKACLAYAHATLVADYRRRRRAARERMPEAQLTHG